MDSQSLTDGPDETLSAAVILYVGKGRFPAPRKLSDEVLDTYGPAYVAQVRALVREIEATQVDWSAGLSAASTEATQRLAANHPELSPDALAALRWYVSYVWR
ncbi:MAG TPA: hypothetical protein PLL54_00785 [Dermatophilaceae bacterium]|jgi:hypothetical protein|nr:hypothetical protein [Dermatophilaceae bacterium]